MGAIAAGALALAMGVRLADGTYTSLVQGWYGPVLLATVVVLALLAGLAAWRWVRTGTDGETARIGPLALGGVALVAVPIGLALLVKPEPLGSSSLELDGDKASTWQLAPGDTGADPSQRNIYQWFWEFENTAPSELIGDPVKVIGFVHHSEDDGTDTFRVARFVVACCVADATGVWLPVQSAEAGTLAKDEWVRVEGRVAIGPSGAPVVQASVVTPVEAPSNPYIYP